MESSADTSRFCRLCVASSENVLYCWPVNSGYVLLCIVMMQRIYATQCIQDVRLRIL